jgi:hypothetical protein
VLADLKSRVEDDDSFEGSLEYLIPERPHDHQPTDVVRKTSALTTEELAWCGACGMGANSEAELERFHAGDPTETEDGERTDFMLRAAYRVGNSMGQGGMVLIGERR